MDLRRRISQLYSEDEYVGDVGSAGGVMVTAKACKELKLSRMSRFFDKGEGDPEALMEELESVNDERLAVFKKLFPKCKGHDAVLSNGVI